MYIDNFWNIFDIQADTKTVNKYLLLQKLVFKNLERYKNKRYGDRDFLATANFSFITQAS